MLLLLVAALAASMGHHEEVEVRAGGREGRRHV